MNGTDLWIWRSEGKLYLGQCFAVANASLVIFKSKPGD